MKLLKAKTILLCVSGGIAAYKAAALTSKLAQAGADVHVLLSANAGHFVTPVTFQALSRNKVYEDVFEEDGKGDIAHIDLADEADLIIAAPATADLIGKIASGIADDMVTTTILASKAPVWIAPAMNVNMYEHPAVQRNMKLLDDFGYRFLEAGEGMLACGWFGKGRLAEPEDIVDAVNRYFLASISALQDKKVLITAGPTQEKVDPVRFFSNHSSGKMGYALAEAAALRGAEVTLVSGPVALSAPANAEVVSVVSAEEMYHEVMARYPQSDVVIGAAAVSDYRPRRVSEQKVKKQPDNLSIEMERTHDILGELGNNKEDHFLVGFAAESENVEAYALQKLNEKQLDMIVANRIVGEHSGFRGDSNKVTIYKHDGTNQALAPMPKSEAAAVILDEIAAMVGECTV